MNRTDSVTSRPTTTLMSVRGTIASRRAVSGTFAWVVLLMLACWLGIESPGWCQPPATYPPAEKIRPATGPPRSGDLPIQGIMFLDKFSVPVYQPPMTYEEYLALERGGKSQTRRYLFESVKIDGRVEGNRAELTVEVRVAVDATGGETIEIPLAMENFHLLGPAEFFAGSKDGNKLAVSVDEDAGNCKLIASVKADTVVGFRMQMSSRVETEPVHSIDFRLPPAPVVINLISDSRDVVGQIPNRDDEVIETSTDPTGKSQFKVESSGGRFTMQWGRTDRPVSMPLLEATSAITMQWNSPQDQLIQNVRMTIRDARGPVADFNLRVPQGATIRDDPKLITSGQFGQLVELSQPDPNDKELFQITIPKAEQEKTIALEFRLEIPSDSPSAEKALPFQVPVVVGALRNQGTINITTDEEYRLRWQQRPYVKNTTSVGSEDTAVDQRSYSFQFIRGAFTLPLWLDATKSELRVSSDCDIELRDNYANLAMEIRSTGNGNRTQLLSVDLADWQASGIENARTGAPLPWYESNGMIEIEVSYTGMEESIPVLIKAGIPIGDATTAAGDQRVDLPVPRVVGPGDDRDPVTIEEAFVRLSGKGRRSLVVDLDRSTNLERAAISELPSALERGATTEPEGGGSSDSSGAARIFAVMPPESSARIVGEMLVQSPRLNLQNTSNVKLIGGQLVTTVDWVIQTPVDLEGRLRIAIPESGDSTLGSDNRPLAATETTATATTATEIVAAGADPSAVLRHGWTVKVNDTAARLRRIAPEELDDSWNANPPPTVATRNGDSNNNQAANRPTTRTGYYELISDALGSGKMNVHFVRSAPVNFDQETSEAEAEIGMPYPLVQDITLQGNVAVELLGGELHDITPLERSLADQLVFRTLPTRTIPLRVSPRAPVKSELLTGKIIVRSAISEVSQHDQVIASLSGTGEFELTLAEPKQIEIQVTLDGVPAAYKIIEDRLVIRIPPDQPEHLVDIRLWVDRSSRSLIQTAAPLAHIGPGSGELFWQLVVPPDCHLVWATPSVGREMQWVFDQWRLIRRPLLTETALINRITMGQTEAIELSPMPNGNSYLLSSMDDRSFRVLAGSRTVLWMIVAGVMVFVSAVLTYIPATRNPFSLVLAIACFAGLLVIAPDALILVGQVSMLALILVVVMLAIRSLVTPTPSRVLTTSRDSRGASSVHSRRKPSDYRSPSSIAVTHSIGTEDITSTPGEVAS